MSDILFPVVLRKHPDGRCETVDLRDEGDCLTVRWLPHGEPLPAGWKRCNEALSHHSRHAVLIERVT